MSASLRKRLNCCVAAKRRDGPIADIRKSYAGLLTVLVGT
jgi:hypothetical protein